MKSTIFSNTVLLFGVLLIAFYNFHPSASMTIRVGHIGAVGVMPNGDRVLNISRTELIKEGVLSDDFDIE
jgi:hypothetical protein